jgi:hypothetical protein
MTTTEMSRAREADECIALEMLSSAPPNAHPTSHFPLPQKGFAFGVEVAFGVALVITSLLHDLELTVA